MDKIVNKCNELHVKFFLKKLQTDVIIHYNDIVILCESICL